MSDDKRWPPKQVSRAAENRAHLVEVLARIGEEDHAALSEAYRLTSAKLFGICLRICGKRGDAEDVLQDVYLTIWKRAGAFEPGRASPISWLATIARNRSIDWVRARGKRPTQPIEDAAAIVDRAPDQFSVMQSVQAANHLLDSLDQLDANQRDAIRKAFFDGSTYAELADAKGVPLGTMKSWVRRGLLRLRESINDE